jgi:hypothetical protein
MFNIGTNSAMMNTNLLLYSDKATPLPDIRFRIIGRQALSNTGKDASSSEKKPPMSWSVPFTFPFVMMKRINKDKMAPLPVDVDKVSVLDNFQEG